MSLLLHRRVIARAIAGELSARAELALREHLSGCAPCREHYDSLARVGAALASRNAQGRAADRARARLVAALPAPAVLDHRDEARARPRLPRWAWGALGIVPVLTAALLLLRPVTSPTPPLPPTPYVANRGGERTEASAPAVLLIFASHKDPARGHGPVRLVAELPGSGEGRVSLDDYVQFSVRGLHAPAFVTVVGVDDAGEVHTYVPRAGAAPPHITPAASATSLGASIDLARGHRPGRLRLYGLLSAEPLSPERVRAAAAQLDRGRPGAPALDLAVPQVAGLLTIEP